MSSLSRPGALRAEQQAGAQAAGADRAQFGGGAARGQHRLDDVARPRAGGEDVVQVGDGVGHGVVHGQRVEDAVGAGGVAPGLFLRPAVARGDQAQVEQPAIGHGAGDRADIVGQLRAHQDDHRAVADRARGRRRRRGRSSRQARARSCRVGAVLQQHALVPPGSADRIGAGEIARPARGQRARRCAASMCGGVLRRRGTRRPGRRCSSPSTSPAARSPAAAAASPASAASASACIAAIASGVFRSSHSASSTGAGHVVRRRRRACAPGRGRSGPVARAPPPAPASEKSSVGAIMRAQQQQPHRLAGRARQHVAHGEEIAEAFRHLLAVHQQHAVVQPDAGEAAAGEGAAALRQLVLVVRKDQVAAAAVDVEGLAQIAPRHGAALDVPARPAAAPGAVPARQVGRWRASTARNRRGRACTAPRRRARRPAVRPGCGRTGGRSRESWRPRTARGPRRRRRGRRRSAAR